MNNKNTAVEDGIVVSEPVFLRPLREPKYGTIEDLAEDELASLDELEREVWQKEFQLLRQLPAAKKECSIRPAIDEDGKPDWGAFGTVDFDRYGSGFDKARYKADKLQERVKDVSILFSIVSERIAGRAKYGVLRYMNRGIIDIGHIKDFDMYQLAELFLRIKLLRQEIAKLKEAGDARQERKMRAFLA